MRSGVYNYYSVFSQCFNSTNDTIGCDIEFSTNKMTFCLNCNVYKSRMQSCWKKENDLSNLHPKEYKRKRQNTIPSATVKNNNQWNQTFRKSILEQSELKILNIAQSACKILV